MKKSKKVQPSPAQTQTSPAATDGKAPFASHWLLSLAAIVAAYVVYGPSISGQFVYDDMNLPFLTPSYAQASFWSWIAGVRPVLMASYWMNFQISGLETTSYHIVNILLHALNSVLLGFAVKQVSTSAKMGLLCGAIFLAHPLNTEAVSYVASRSENLTVFFFLAAFVLFLYRKSVEIDFATSAAVIVLFGAACMSKEYAVTLPVLLVLTDLYFNPHGLKKNWRVYAPLLVAGAAGGLFVARILSKADTAGFALKDLSAADYFFTQCRAIWVYIGKFLLPIGLNVDHDFAISRGPMDHGALFGLLGLLAVSAAALWFRKEYPVASYGWFVFLLLLAPTSSFVPIRDVLVERRAYLPSLGLLLIIAGLLPRIPRIPMPAYAVPVLILAVLTYQRNVLWAEPLALWRDAAEKSPNKWRVQFQVADALYRQGDCAQSAAAFEKTSTLAKPDYRLLINWAHALECAGQSDQALARANQALALESSAQAYSLIGMLHAKHSRLPEALAALDKAIAIDSRFDPAYLYRGNVYMMQNDLAKAAEDYQRALTINPSNEQAARGLARANRR
jgi:tetratricopeptide (TPR) repeat protein